MNDDALAAVESKHLSNIAQLDEWPDCAVVGCDVAVTTLSDGLANLCQAHFDACRLGGREVLSLKFERRNVLDEPLSPVRPDDHASEVVR